MSTAQQGHKLRIYKYGGRWNIAGSLKGRAILTSTHIQWSNAVTRAKALLRRAALGLDTACDYAGTFTRTELLKLRRTKPPTKESITNGNDTSRLDKTVGRQPKPETRIGAESAGRPTVNHPERNDQQRGISTDGHREVSMRGQESEDRPQPENGRSSAYSSEKRGEVFTSQAIQASSKQVGEMKVACSRCTLKHMVAKGTPPPHYCDTCAKELNRAPEQVELSKKNNWGKSSYLQYKTSRQTKKY